MATRRRVDSVDRYGIARTATVNRTPTRNQKGQLLSRTNVGIGSTALNPYAATNRNRDVSKDIKLVHGDVKSGAEARATPQGQKSDQNNKGHITANDLYRAFGVG